MTAKVINSNVSSVGRIQGDTRSPHGDQGFNRVDAVSHHITHQLMVLGEREFSEAAIQLKMRSRYSLILLQSQLDALGY